MSSSTGCFFETEHYKVIRAFLSRKERRLEELLKDDECEATR